MKLSKKIYLASKSPRRQELMKLMGFDYELLWKDVDESYPPDLSLLDVAVYIAQKKADAFESEKDGVILTSDTVVLWNGRILGKPVDRADAIQMLTEMNAEMHQVITGVCLKTEEETISFSETTEVYFRKLDPEEITFYIDEYQPYDKAGAYGIQEWIGLVAIEKIVGSYTNVMGLPTEKLYEKLKSLLQH